MVAIAIGIACYTTAHHLVQVLARQTQLPPHSRVGFTFLWRLHFLKTLPPAERAALLQKVSDRTSSTRTRQLIALLGQMYEEEADLNGAGPFLERAMPLLFPSQKYPPWEKVDQELNQMACAFLLPPTPEHLRASMAEFITALKMPAGNISVFLFVTTVFYFENKSVMPACAELVTFRESKADQIMQIPAQRLYFRLGQGVNSNVAFLIWFGSLLALVLVAWWKKVNVSAIAAFGIALTSVGLLMIGSTCLLGEFLPRYALPMWELLCLSIYIFVGKTAGLFSIKGSRTAAGNRDFETVRRAACRKLG